MSELRAAKTGDVEAFPGSAFVVVQTPPPSQCSEARIESITGTTTGAPDNLPIDFGKFDGEALTGKKVTILTNPNGNIGTFGITGNDDSELTLDGDPGTGAPTAYYIHNGGSLILTRDVQSFADFIHANGYAYTIKGGKLHTNIPSIDLQPACSILFAPLT